MTRNRVSAVLALGVTGLFLWLALRNVRFGELGGLLAAARWRWLPFLFALSLVDLLIRALRWRILLSRAAKPGLWLLIRLEAIGLAVNNVLFLRLGELARAFLAGRELRLPTLTALASVAVERALDVSALLTLFVAASATAPDLVPQSLRRAGLLALLAACGALALLALAEGPLEPGGSWERRLRRWPRVHALASQLAAGAAVLRGPRAAASAAGLSLLLWAVDALFYWASARALGLAHVVDYPRSVLVLSWAGAGAALPAAPGAFGTFEAMVKGILVAFGATPEQALAYAVFNHMLMYLFVTVIGLAFLSRLGLTLAELQHGLKEARR